MNTLRIALAQINTTVGDLEGNAAKVIASLKASRAKDADLVLFPEMALTGYPPEDLLFKSQFIQDELKALKALAKATRTIKGVAAVVGFVDHDKAGIYNAAAVLAQGRILGVYRKHALPNYSVFDEKRYFLPASSKDGLGLFMVRGIPVAVNICEDIWIKDGVFTAQAKKGAKVVLNLSSSPYEAGKRGERLKLLKGVAARTKAHVCYTNLVGGQDELVFDGASMVVAPNGKILASGVQFAEDLVVCDIPVGKVTAKKGFVAVPLAAKKEPSVCGPVLAPVLDDTAEIYAAVVLGTRDYIQKNGFKKVVLGLSGGIDSALVAAIACDAVGKENVVGISMPTRFNVEATRSDARTLAANLGIEFHEIPIETVFQANLLTLAPFFGDGAFGLAEENLQSRIRGNILMAFSNKFGWLLLTTGNKSEMATGYCTLYGDMSGGYAVIKDILKTRVYDLSAHVNLQAGAEVIPHSIFTRAPSAELRPNQTDQDSLPSYPVLDALLVEYVEKNGSFKDMVRATKDAPAARRVVGLVDRSEYKRRQAPPGVKITKRAFGKDWRLPLTNRYKVF